MQNQILIFSDITPYFSIVIPIHNQDKIIVEVLRRILMYTEEMPYELICILDACSDNTDAVVTSFFSSNRIPELLTKVTIVVSKIPLFETACDNIGARLAKGKFFLEIQADIIIDEPGYNMKLLRPFTIVPNVIGVSGRCTHGLINPVCVGKIGNTIEVQLPHDVDFTKFYVGETCNRGPLLIELAKLEELHYFDEENFFLDDSDHDLFARAYVQKQWICGYVPIEIMSNLEDGSTRKERDALNQEYYTRMMNRPTTGGFLKTYMERMQDKDAREIYVIDLYRP